MTLLKIKILPRDWKDHVESREKNICHIWQIVLDGGSNTWLGVLPLTWERC